MVQKARIITNPPNVLAVIMGGGQGTRLFPLTRDRSKPAVPLAGKYRLVDIPISNCINSGLKRIYLLTQFNSASLHRHISQSYKFDQFSGGFVEILAAEQTFSDTSWYQGTADAVRKNLLHFLNHDFDYLLILSGDQLYRMDFQDMIRTHQENKAAVTIAALPPQIAVAGGRLQVKSNRFGVKLSCSRSTCTGSLKVEAVELLTVKHGKRKVKKHRTVVIGRASFSVAAGQSGTTTIALNGTGRKLLRKAKSHKLGVQLLASATGGNSASHNATLWIKVAKKRKR